MKNVGFKLRERIDIIGEVVLAFINVEDVCKVRTLLERMRVRSGIDLG